MFGSLRMCQPSRLAARVSKTTLALACAALAAGCSADVTRFDLGSSPPSNAAASDQGNYNATYGSASSAEQGGYQRAPQAFQPNTVARQDLAPAAAPDQAYGGYASPQAAPQYVPPAAAQPMTTSAIGPDPYANAGRYAAPVSQGATAAAEPGQEIEVRQGDTLYGLARRHGVTVDGLRSANNLQGTNLKPGQKLYLPKGSTGAARMTAAESQAPVSSAAERAPASATTTTAEAPADWTGSHTVKPGESLYKISRDIKVNLNDLERYNGIADARKVKPGTVLKVPGSAGNDTAAKAAPQETAKTADASPATPSSAPALEQAAASTPATSSSQEPKILNAEPSKVAAAEPSTKSDADAPPASVTGTPKLRWPVVGKVVSGFGPRPDGTHNDGINVQAPLGTDVHAAEAGVVAYAGDELKGYGNLVLVRHDNGWVTAYAHGDEILVKRGDRVKRGQVIAKAGRTGQVDQPQLHFELRQGQKPVDPTPFMDKM